ncbi:MAG: putative toxin-antitoxin system toxin component, PIN family [Chlamydiae bacterium]|nr:putative toxin-antitoxin system toxin component, PIN family [Chlamydiota bacterium]MBI3277928.1 putative toxin-antitoxin system toxin component, PIN family [Chlamydiota bacterium]
MSIIKVVLDTNILISAIVFGGKPKKILEMAIKGKISIAVSHPLIQELRGVLEGNKFQYPEEATEIILTELISVGEMVSPTEKISVISNDPPDNRILECAITAKANCIVSGDHDLFTLKEFQGIPIYTADQFLKLYPL